MPRNTSVTLGEHFEAFIASQVKTGRYESKSEVIRAAMRLLEEREGKIAALRQALIDGENSGDAGILDMEAIRRRAKQDASLEERDV